MHFQNLKQQASQSELETMRLREQNEHLKRMLESEKGKVFRMERSHNENLRTQAKVLKDQSQEDTTTQQKVFRLEEENERLREELFTKDREIQNTQHRTNKMEKIPIRVSRESMKESLD